MVRIDSFSSLPPHIQPPMAQVPSAIREELRLVPLILMCSSMLSLSCSFLKIVVFLAQPLWVRVGAVELVARFIKFKLAGFRGFRRFSQKSRNLGRVQRLE